MGSKPIIEALSTRSSHGPLQFLLGTYRLSYTCVLPGHWTALVELPLAITLGCHCLGCQSFCPTAGQDASCKLENSASLTHQRKQAYEHYQAYTQTYTHINMDMHAYRNGVQLLQMLIEIMLRYWRSGQGRLEWLPRTDSLTFTKQVLTVWLLSCCLAASLWQCLTFTACTVYVCAPLKQASATFITTNSTLVFLGRSEHMTIGAGTFLRAKPITQPTFKPITFKTTQVPAVRKRAINGQWHGKVKQQVQVHLS